MRNIKKILFLFSMMISFCNVFSQKQIIKPSDFDSWPEIKDEKISNDGKFVLYNVNSKQTRSLLYVQSTTSQFDKVILIGNDAFFTENSQIVVFKNAGDSLGMLNLITRNKSYIGNVKSIKVPKEGVGKWLVYQSFDNELVLLNLLTNKSRSYIGVTDYVFGLKGKVLLLQTKNPVGNNKKERDSYKLELLDLDNNLIRTIYQGNKANNLTVDELETQVAFVVSKEHKDSKVIMYHNEKMRYAIPLVTKLFSNIDNKAFEITDSRLSFSPNGKKLFFDLRKKTEELSIDTTAVSLDVWHYKDPFLQSQQLVQKEMIRRTYLGVVNLKFKKVKIIDDKEGLTLINPILQSRGDGEFVLYSTEIYSDKQYRDSLASPDFYIVNTNDGSIKCIKKHLYSTLSPNFSPCGNYVVWFDDQKKAYFSYNARKNITKNITEGIPQRLCQEIWSQGFPPWSYGLALWQKKDGAILLYDRYDIWQVDPDGIKIPVNITCGYGRKNRIQLRLICFKQNGTMDLSSGYKDEVLIKGIDENNQNNSIYNLKLTSLKGPRLLHSSEDAIYGENFGTYFFCKAKNVNRYLLKKSNANKFPNLEVTDSFSKYTQISELKPEVNYNWLSSELVHWKTFDGRPGSGILYKPENFNPKKRYPIIFYFYERLTDQLNYFIDPAPSVGPINIPTFVSQEYLVFCPDIYYNIGNPGAGIYNYVVSAAETMAKQDWVDKNHMGIQGHSFGGFEVNYLVTNTAMFAAASSAAGMSDLISFSSTLRGNVTDAHAVVEQSQCRMGTSIWLNMDGYIKNSPIFYANRITTPLLMMHNKADGSVPWLQSVELFTSLRRQDKRVWLLQYDGEGHDVNGKSALDYHTRLLQFFNHYLKGQQAPKWMINGIPANLKMIDRGLSLDTIGRLP